MKILDYVPAAIGKKWEEDAKRGDDILRLVTPVIDDDIDPAHLLDNRTEKCPIGLRAHPDLG